MKKLIETLNETFEKKFEINNISKVEIDSRKIDKNDIFIAINNGKNYIQEVLDKGASLIICDDKHWENNNRVIVVEDSIKAMQLLAKNYRQKLNTKIIGITGSEGKTTTKDIIHGVLSSKYKTKKTLGNYNNHIGLPFTILQLKDDDEFGVIEMGMSHKGEIPVLCEIAGIDYGVITNIGDSHLEFMINRDNVFEEKSQIKDYIPKENLFIFGDDVYLSKLQGNKIGFNIENNFIINNYNETSKGVKFSLNNEDYLFKLNGKHNCINASIAISLGLSLGLSKEEIQTGLDSVQITPMRFEKIIKDGIFYINDAYNASPVSMKASLETFNNIKFDNKKLAVIADMGEMGSDEIKYHRDVINFALTTKIDNFILLGERMKKALEGFNDERLSFCNSKAEIKMLINKKYKDNIILLKGSNFNHLWEII